MTATGNKTVVKCHVTEKVVRRFPKKYNSKKNTDNIYHTVYKCMLVMGFVEALTPRQLVCQFPILHGPRYIVLQPGRARSAR